MPEGAKVLPFRARVGGATYTREEAAARARAFLSLPIRDRSHQIVEQTYSDGDVLTAICAQLSELTNSSPSSVSAINADDETKTCRSGTRCV